MGNRFFGRLLKYEWRYHNIILLLISVVLAWSMVSSAEFAAQVASLGSMGYIGAFFAGAMFSYGLTTPLSIAIVVLLAENLSPLALAAIAACGAVISDYIIFRFVRDGLSKEFGFLVHDLHLHLPPFPKPKWWKKFVPILAGFIIASPLPDELASALFGAVHFKTSKFLVYSYFFNLLGIFVIAYLSAG
ncbi:MAG: hypothetical protein HY519_03825 [Candidatus Aenigmarchaeota archaeon]|nr:hypothetical protein [Candidatus Aenigmarchaeota archaeon]